MRIVNGTVFADGMFEQREVHAVDGRFAETGGEADVVEAQGCYVIPGLVDVHFHGCVGHDFCDATAEAYEAIARYEASRGVTAICPATMTYPEEKLASIMDAARAFEISPPEIAFIAIKPMPCARQPSTNASSCSPAR